MRASAWAAASPPNPAPTTTTRAIPNLAPMNFIGGKWVAARSGRTMEDRNPADAGDLLGEVARSDAADIDDAVAAAKAAYAGWFATPMPKRGDHLRRIGQLLEVSKDELSQLM